MRFSKTQIGLLVALLVGNAIILYANLDWSWLRFPVAVVFMFVLPGWAWLPALGWLKTRDGIERVTLLVGLSSLLSALALLVALMSLPGRFNESTALLALNLVTLAGLLAQFLPGLRPEPASQPLAWPPRTVLLVLLAIMIVAAATRLTRIDYAEFHEDELENMRLIVRAYKGEAYAPFLDSKGPIHWLMPAALWFLHGWLTEGLARTPFATTSLLLVPMIYILGRRISGGRNAIGLIAAGFVALNGFFVAYARFVENQSLIILWGTVAVWLAYRYYRDNIPQFLLPLALTLAVGLVAHPDMLLYLPVFAYIIWLKLREQPGSGWRRQWPWLTGAGLLFAMLVALFYVPYLADPQIGLIYQYFASDRIGESFLYNSVPGLLDQDRLYSTRYHAPVLVGLLAWLMARHFAQLHGRGWLLFAGLSLAIVSTLVLPSLWLAGSINLAFLPYALLTLALLWLPRTDVETKILFLWLSLPLGALLFLAQDAADHVQIAYPAWALLAALALDDIWLTLSPANRSLPARVGLPAPLSLHQKLPNGTSLALKSFIVFGLVLVAGLILAYQYLTFDSRVVDYWQAKIDYETNPDSLYGRLYGSISRPRRIFSNPSLSGWKVAGFLWETGRISGDFRSVNESYAIPVWYTFETPRSCYEDPRHYWLRRDWQGWPEEEQELVDQGYVLSRIVQVDQEPMLHLYEKGATPDSPEVLNLEDYRRQFDRLATPARFAREEMSGRHTSFNFDQKLRLVGYYLPAGPVKAGDLVPVTVYWESLLSMEVRYRGFVHLVGPDDTRWGQHDDDPACRLLTTDMRPGQRSSRQFRLPVDAATPPGEYNVLFGLYDPATLERLEIWDELSNQAAGNTLVLGQIKVE